MNPAELCLRHNRVTWLIYAILMLAGLQTFFTIGRLEYPPFTIRNAQIITTYPGRTSQQVEEQVTEPIEQAIRQMAEVKKITSTSKAGLSILVVEVHEEYFDLEPIWQDLRNKVAAVSLPTGASRPNVNDEFGDVFPYVFALHGDGYSAREMLDTAEDIRDRLLSVNGVAKVAFHGDQPERVYVEFSSSKLAAYAVSTASLTSQLGSQNAVADSGDVVAGSLRLNLLTRGEFENIQELADTRLTVPGQSTSIRLSDIATVRRAPIDPAQAYCRHDAERVISIAVSMVDGGVVTEIGDRVAAEVDAIQAELPIGLDIERIFFQPEYVGASIRAFLSNLAQAFLFVVVVMFLFAGLRIALIIGILVPSATLGAFVFMPWAGVQLEMMSIAALIIALGLLVDNAVVVSEQILVRLGNGVDRRTAMIESVGGLGFPLLAASGTTIAAFLPIRLSPGGIGEFCYSLFAVVSLTLLASWALSLTVIPLFCYYFLRPLKRDTWVGRLFQRVYAPYERLLRRMLAWGWGYPLIILALTMVAGWSFQFVPSIFFPPNERGQFVIDLELPLGTDLAETERCVERMESWLLESQGDRVRSVTVWIGQGGPKWYLSLTPEPANPNYAFFSVLTHSDDPADIVDLIDEIHRHAEYAFPSARVTAKPLENGPPVGDPIQLRLFGRDLDELYAQRDALAGVLKSAQGVTDIRDDWGVWVKQVSIEPDLVRASRLGLTTRDIAQELNVQYRGSVATDLLEEDRVIPVVLRSRDDYRLRPERLPDLPIYSAEGGSVPLGQIAETKLEFLPGTIKRENTTRVMTIKARVQGRFTSDVLAELQPKVAEYAESDAFPSGYWVEWGGELKESAEAQGKIFSAMPIALGALLLILISQFNSFRRVGIVGLTIPPMLIGVVPGLLITGSTFGFMTLLGLIALMGIIVNNAILLIDATEEARRNRADEADGLAALTESIVDAATSRLRPIVMTTITTMIGLVPLAVGGGGMWSSMAVAMMSGLAFATALTLVLCPVLYYLCFRRGAERSSESV